MSNDILFKKSLIISHKDFQVEVPMTYHPSMF